MSKLLKICMVVAAVLSFTGCYNDFDDPAHDGGDRVRSVDHKVLSRVTSQALHRQAEQDRKSTRLNSSHASKSRMPSSA